MNQLYTVCGASPINNQILSFDGHDIHFDGYALLFMEDENIQPLLLKSINSGNYHPNYNGTNVKLKSCLNNAKSTWILKYGTTQFFPHHVNSIFMEVRGAFKVSSGNIIRESFMKTNIILLVTPIFSANSQACVASIQVPCGTKVEDPNAISQNIVVPIKLQEIRTKDLVDSIQGKGY